MHDGQELEGIRLEFEDGKVVGASAAARRGHPPRHPRPGRGRRRIGELGIGCNPGHHALHEERPLRREDRRLDPSRARPELHRRSAARTRAPSTGTSSRTSGRAGVSSSTGRSCSRTAPGASECGSRSRPVPRFPELEPDDRLLLPALAAHGIEGVPAVWDDRAVDGTRSTSSSCARPGTTRSAATSSSPGPGRCRASRIRCRCSSGTPTSATSSDLAAAGVPTVQTRFVAAGTMFEPPAEPFVVKPSVSAGGRSSARFGPRRPWTRLGRSSRRFTPRSVRR